MSRRLAAALEFAELGCRVVIVRGKNPGGYLGDAWQHKATRDETVLRDWWRRAPDGNVGILGDGAIAPLDNDNPAEFERLQAETVPCPPTPRYLTGGLNPPGRERLLFAHPGETGLGTTLAAGVQLRIGTLMSTVPPGVHPESGMPIEWVAALDEVPLAPLPKAWLERVRPRRTAGGKPKGRPIEHWIGEIGADRGKDDRHPAMPGIAGFLMHKLGSAQLVAELMLGWNLRHCKPPKPEQEVIDVVRWAAERELRK